MARIQKNEKKQKRLLFCTCEQPLFAFWANVKLFYSGFEHSIANMYYIPAGILAKADPLFVEKALELGASQQAIDALGWGSMFSANLLPVTLGNILGGAFFVGLAYWLAYRRAA